MYETTTWRRLEPRTRDEELTGSLEGSVHDPLWLLGRQWQIGEFDGVDAGSPVSVRLSVDERRVSAYGLGDGTPEIDYGPESPPLETLVERERVTRDFDDPDRNLRDAAEAGAHFVRLLAAEGLDYEATDFENAAALDSYDVDTLLLDVTSEDLDPEGERFATALSGRVLDGDRLYHVIRQSDVGLAGPLPVPDSSLKTGDGYDQSYLDAVTAFRDWYGEVYSELGDGSEASAQPDAWDHERMEYAFSVAVGADDDRRELVVSEYEGGGLDWYDFAPKDSPEFEIPELPDDLDEYLDDVLEGVEGLGDGDGETGASGGDGGTVASEGEQGGGEIDEIEEILERQGLGDVADLREIGSIEELEEIENVGELITADRTVSAQPTPVRFSGMPARRWWAFEDGEVNVPNVDAASEDLSRLLLAEYALVSGSDWFRVPVDLPVGSLTTIWNVTVTDTFGRTTTVGPTADSGDSDDSSDSGDSWRLFDFAYRDGDAVERSLFLPPTVPESLSTDPVEEVAFARDDAANVAWALEEAVEGPTGDRLDRHEQSQQAAAQVADAPLQPTTDADWAYRLSTTVPDYWLPLVPVQRGKRGTDLELGEMLVSDHDHETDPKGAILDAENLRIPEEEVPRTGKRVSRHYRHARWTDGSAHLWSSREVGLGNGEVASDLQFDVLAERPPGETVPLTVATVSQRSAGGTFQNLSQEYVAFRNDAGRALDLTGWTVADRAGHEYEFPDGFTLDAGDVVRLHTGEGSDDESDLYWDSGAPVWNDAVDAIHVYDADAQLVATQTYPDLGAVPDDSPFEFAVLADPPGDDYENLEGELLGVENTGDESVDLTGWRVEDLFGRRYEFPDGFEVDAGDWVIVVTGEGSDTENALYWGADKPVWNNDGDAVLLYDDRDVLMGGTLV